MRLTKKASDLLDKVVAFAEEEPRRFNMETWFNFLNQHDGEIDPETLNTLKITGNDVPKCGTVACVAGTVCILAGLCNVDVIDGLNYYDPPREGWFHGAKKVLGLTQQQAQSLFFHTREMAGVNGSRHSWPKKFERMYTEATGPEGRVAALKARVKYFKRYGK